MNLKNITIVLITLCATAGKAQVMSLDSILVTVEKNNPELQMYDAQVNEFNTYAKGAKAWEAPQVSAGLFMTPYNPTMWKADNTGNGMGSFMVQGQQMIPNPAKQKANQNYMQSMSAVESANKNIAKNQLLAEAKMNYYEWVILKKKLALLNEQEELVNYIIKTTEIRYPYGQEKLNSLYKAKATLAEIQTNKVMVESEISWKRIYLNQLMNRDKYIVFEIDQTIIVKEYEKTSVDTASLISRRSDIASIDKSILVSQYKQRYEKSRLKPDFGIQYAHMFSFGNNPNLFSFMGMMSIPIAPWSSKMYKSTSSGLNYQIQGYQKQREAIVNEATGELESIKWRITNQKQQIELYENTLLPALEKNYKSSLIAYEQNTEDLFVVLDAIQALQMGNMELLNKKRELLLLQTEYEKTMEQR